MNKLFQIFPLNLASRQTLRVEFEWYWRIAPPGLKYKIFRIKLKTFYDISHNMIFAFSLQTYPLPEMTHYRSLNWALIATDQTIFKTGNSLICNICSWFSEFAKISGNSYIWFPGAGCSRGNAGLSNWQFWFLELAMMTASCRTTRFLLYPLLNMMNMTAVSAALKQSRLVERRNDFKCRLRIQV